MITRLWKAFNYSLDGLKAAFKSEFAIRLEVLLSVILTPAILLSDLAITQKGILLFAMILVFIAELINTAIEALANTITTKIHPNIKKAKDIGSAVVLVAIVNFLIVAGCIVSSYY